MVDSGVQQTSTVADVAINQAPELDVEVVPEEFGTEETSDNGNERAAFLTTALAMLSERLRAMGRPDPGDMGDMLELCITLLHEALQEKSHLEDELAVTISRVQTTTQEVSRLREEEQLLQLRVHLLQRELHRRAADSPSETLVAIQSMREATEALRQERTAHVQAVEDLQAMERTLQECRSALVEREAELHRLRLPATPRDGSPLPTPLPPSPRQSPDRMDVLDTLAVPAEWPVLAWPLPEEAAARSCSPRTPAQILPLLLRDWEAALLHLHEYGCRVGLWHFGAWQTPHQRTEPGAPASPVPKRVPSPIFSPPNTPADDDIVEADTDFLAALCATHHRLLAQLYFFLGSFQAGVTASGAGNARVTVAPYLDRLSEMSHRSAQLLVQLTAGLAHAGGAVSRPEGDPHPAKHVTFSPNVSQVTASPPSTSGEPPFLSPIPNRTVAFMSPAPYHPASSDDDMTDSPSATLEAETRRRCEQLLQRTRRKCQRLEEEAQQNVADLELESENLSRTINVQKKALATLELLKSGAKRDMERLNRRLTAMNQAQPVRTPTYFVPPVADCAVQIQPAVSDASVGTEAVLPEAIPRVEEEQPLPHSHAPEAGMGLWRDKEVALDEMRRELAQLRDASEERERLREQQASQFLADFEAYRSAVLALQSKQKELHQEVSKKEAECESLRSMLTGLSASPLGQPPQLVVNAPSPLAAPSEPLATPAFSEQTESSAAASSRQHRELDELADDMPGTERHSVQPPKPAAPKRQSRPQSYVRLEEEALDLVKRMCRESRVRRPRSPPIRMPPPQRLFAPIEPRHEALQGYVSTATSLAGSLSSTPLPSMPQLVPPGVAVGTGYTAAAPTRPAAVSPSASSCASLTTSPIPHVAYSP
eukprot:TRINITY_DN13431_c0_g1_i1.p1 TRINITY_DN13431_c0_g1~~TRINITY_DN13431_c0_g1_i1.p1  ORF type:complete len:882 (+),score=141.99 TRINITY_DN13431_c0_g1_i1:21-2666(+)